MKKLLLFLSTLCSIYYSNAQTIVANNTSYTVPQLVENILFGSESTTGTGVISNITWSTGTNFGSTNGIGSFTNSNSNFPLSSGIILSTGNAMNSPGPNNTTQSNGNWPGDAQLFNYINGLGIDPSLTNHHNATVIEFDFIPLITNMSFDFIFASEEYGIFQCSFSDAFAFFVNDVTAGTPVVNLALVPNTNDPISVITIRNNLYNTGCGPVNPDYFDKYYVLPEGVNPAIAPIDFNGNTVVMTAATDVIPNHTYHIKLVIADRNDSLLDSAVFMGGGSFYVGQELRGMYGSGYENYKDFTIANGGAPCPQETRQINLGMTPITGATYEWYRDDIIIAGADQYTYTIDQPGEYKVKMKFLPSTAEISDTFIVEYLPMPIENPVDLYSENLVYDLTENRTTILAGQNPADYEIHFYTSLVDAQNMVNPIVNATTYNGVNGQQIFVSVNDVNTGCMGFKSFMLYQFLSSDTFDSGDVLHFPNPVSNLLNLSSHKNINSVEIRNLLGQQLFSKSINSNDAQIDMSDFSSGTYLVKITSEDATSTIKVIKN